MKTFVKNYIGKGKQINNMQIVRITCKLEDLQAHSHEYKGEEYITFEVAKLKNTDPFGNDYTVYVNNLVETPDEQPKTQPKTDKAPKPAKSKKQAASTVDDGNIPF